MADNTFNDPLSPVQRSKPSDRLLLFQKNEKSIYNKFDPYYQTYGSIGPKQPFIYTKLTDSNYQKTLTQYDTQAYPVGSILRDVSRMSKFLDSGAGLLYDDKQRFLQSLNPFNETTTYDRASVISAARRPGTGRPYTWRHSERGTSGRILALNLDSMTASTQAYTTNQLLSNGKINGTATGDFATNAVALKDAQYGLVRYVTGVSAFSKFGSKWSYARPTAYGAIGANRTEWQYRPEYQKGKESASSMMYYDIKNILTYAGRRPLYESSRASTGNFYNDPIYKLTQSERTAQIAAQDQKRQQYEFDKAEAADLNEPEPPAPDIQELGDGLENPILARNVSRNFPRDNASEGTYEYASVSAMTKRFSHGLNDTEGLMALYTRMFNVLASDENQHAMYNRSAERYKKNRFLGQSISLNPSNEVNESNNYKASIPGKYEKSPYLKYLELDGVAGQITIDKRGFSKGKGVDLSTAKSDEYNLLEPTPFESEMYLSGGRQTADIIRFYFYDMVNQIYIPFRATLSSIQDQHSPVWEEIKYMGRADSLFVYKGFTRDVSFSFKVYANSIQELDPMWKRVNYLVGLTRPAGYTDRAYVTNQENTSPFQSQQTTGAESGFIVPPMIRFTVGDLYVNHPAVLRSVNISIPEDATWETLREETYSYIYGTNKKVETRATSRQLPNLIDVTVQMSMIERNKSMTNDNHFGPVSSENGWEMKTDLSVG